MSSAVVTTLSDVKVPLGLSEPFDGKLVVPVVIRSGSGYDQTDFQFVRTVVSAATKGE